MFCFVFKYHPKETKNIFADKALVGQKLRSDKAGIIQVICPFPHF